MITSVRAADATAVRRPFFLGLAAGLLLAGAGTAVARQTPGGAATVPALTNLVTIRSLSLPEARLHLPVDLTGVITWNSDDDTGFVIDNGRSALWIYGRAPAAGRVGSLVRIRGRVTEGYYTVSAFAEQADDLGIAPLPAPRRVPAREQLQGIWDNHRVAVEGTIFHRPNSGGVTELVLLSDGVHLWLSGPAIPAALPPDGTRAEVTGISSLGIRERQIVDCSLLLASWDQIRPLPETNAAPEPVAIREILRGTNGAWLDRPVGLSGTVTWRNASQFVLQDATQGILVQLTNTPAPPTGRRLRVVGGAHRTPGGLGFVASAFEDLGPAALPEPLVPRPDQLLDDPALFGRRIRLAGRLAYRQVSAGLDEWDLVRPGSLENFRFELDRFAGGPMPSFALESTLEVVGVLLPAIGGTNQGPSENVLLPDSPAAVTLLHPPPLPRELTLALAGIAGGSLLLLLGGTAWWGHARRLARVREQQLEAENRLKQRLALIAETASDLIVTLSNSGEITFANPVGQRLLAGDASPVGAQFSRWLVAEHVPPWNAALGTVAAGLSVSPFEIRLDHAPGPPVELEVVLRRLNASELQCIGRDLTEGRQAQRELVRQELRLRTIVDSMAEGILVLDANLTVLSLNPAAERILGVDRATFVGSPVSVFGECVGADGRPLAPDDYPMRKTVRTGSGVDAFQLGFSRHPERRCWLSLNSRVLAVDRDGQVRQLLATFTDITARITAEQQRIELEEQLRRSETLRALGTLAGGVAHDFNNLLASILGNADLSLLELPASHPVAEHVREIAVASRRGAELVRRILSFSRPDTGQRRPLLLSSVVDEAAAVVQRAKPGGVRFQWSAVGTELPVLGDRTQLHQAVTNLCTNAFHALEERGGELEVRVDLIAFTPEQAAVHPPLPAGPVVRLTVRDTGCGMDAATSARLFEPFFTTKDPGRGTGLGMAIVNSVVQAHEGCIRVDSEPGRGTTIRLLLPALTAAPPEPAAAGPAPAAARGQGQTVLLVDDDPAVLRMSARAVVTLGYAVVTATSPADALRQLEERRGEIRLVITDLSMPERSGVDFALDLRQRWPDLPVLIVTGYGPNADQQLARAGGQFPVLGKPFRLPELARELSRLLTA